MFWFKVNTKSYETKYSFHSFSHFLLSFATYYLLLLLFEHLGHL